MDSRRLGTAQERADVMGVLQGIKDQDVRWLATLGCPREDVVQARELTRFDDECHALVAIEAGEGRERATLDLDDRDPQVRGVEHELLERGPSLGDHEESDRRPPRDKGFLDWAPTSYELLVGAERLWGWQG